MMLKGDGNGLPHPALVLLVALASLSLPAAAGAAVIQPNTAADDYDLVPDATCSLREAVQSANQFSDFGGCVATDTGTWVDTTILLDPGTYLLTILPTGANDISSGDLNVVGTPNLTIEALPSGPVTIDGFGADRVIQCTAGGLTLLGLTVSGGSKSDPDPSVAESGGGILAHFSCSLTIKNSTVTANAVDGVGGGIAGFGPISLTNVTVSFNTSLESGGGIAVGGVNAVHSLDHVTIYDDRSGASPSPRAGGVFVSGAATATAHNSIIAGSRDGSGTGEAPDCEGSITSLGGNVIGDTTGCTFNSVAGDMLNIDPMVGPLADNGGATKTHALLSGSPAIDHAVGASPFTDQRGFARPFPVGGACDTGAYEFGASLDPSAARGCLPPPAPPTPPTGTPAGTQLPNPLCATLRKKLRKAKKAHNAAKVRKLRRRLRRLGC